MKTKAQAIVKETRHGHGGPWVTDCRANLGPVNFLKVARAKSSAQKGVGGYFVRIRVADFVLMSPWPEGMGDARRLIDSLAAEQDSEYPEWARII
jgi:hypothetical protein